MPRTTYHVFRQNEGLLYEHVATVEEAPSARRAVGAVKDDSEKLESYFAVPVRNWTGFKVGMEMRMVFEELPDPKGQTVVSLAEAPEEDPEPEPESKAAIRQAAAAAPAEPDVIEITEDDEIVETDVLTATPVEDPVEPDEDLFDK